MGVTVRSTAGVASESPAGTAGGIATFKVPLGPGETFVRVQTAAIFGRGSNPDAESVDNGRIRWKQGFCGAGGHTACRTAAAHDGAAGNGRAKGAALPAAQD